jgi:hypothetical protein
VDLDGEAVETVWDAFNVGLGAVSFADNVNEGNYGWAAVDAIGVVLDSAAVVVPFVPGGAGTAIKVSRVADTADLVKGVDSALSRKAAFRQAKEKANVPRSQNPNKVYSEKLTDQEVHTEGRVYEFMNNDGNKVTIEEHTLGHKKGNQGPHFSSKITDGLGIKQPFKNNSDSHTYIKRN